MTSTPPLTPPLEDQAVTRPASTRRPLPTASGRQTLAALGAELRRLPGLSAAALVLSLGASATGLVAPWAAGRIVDAVAAGGGTGGVLDAALLVAAAALAGGALTAAAAALLARLGETVLARLRERVLDRALHLPTPSLEAAGSGDLVSRVGDDVSVVTAAITTTGPELVAALLTVGLTGAGLFALDWRLGLAGAAALPLYVLALRWYLPRSGPLYARERVAVAERSQALAGSLHGASTVRAYRLEAEHRERVQARSHAAMTLSITSFKLFTRFASRLNRAEFVGLSAVLVIGFWLVRADLATVGATTAAALYFHRLFNPLGALVMEFDVVQQAGASLARLVGVADLPRPAPPQVTVLPTDASVELRGVTHRYGDGPPVLLDVSLKIAAGERVALVGASGAGKTTLASIAAGVLDPAEGAVLLGGVEPSALGEAGVRDHACLVSQEVHVFSGALVDDVRLARPEATDEQVTAALARVGALGWAIALPDGIHSHIGEGAHRLGAAQAQQLALARLLLADPAVAILDEATAEAGSASAGELDRAAAAATAGRTALIVAHRLSQAQHADRIAVLDRGRIVETGTHDELLRAGGRYSQLWEAAVQPRR